MTTIQAVALGIGAGLAVTGARVAWSLWTNRLNGPTDYLVGVIAWWHYRKR